MKVFKLALYGDSLACPRQGFVESHERYIAIIERYIRNFGFDFVEVRDGAMGGAAIVDLYNAFKHSNTYYSLPGNVLIIHAGVVDCAPRPIDQVWRDRISRLPYFIRRRIIKYIHKNRAKLIRKNNPIVRTNKKVFKETLEKFIVEGAMNYDRVYIINICPTTDEMDKHSPGFSKSILEYNKLIMQVLEKSGSEKIKLIDIFSEIQNSGRDLTDYVLKEDGHHIYPLTHEVIAQQIINSVNDILTQAN